MQTIDEKNVIAVYPPSGEVARVTVRNRLVGFVNGAQVNRPTYSEATGIPAPQPDTYYIVSMLVRDAAPDRTDLLSPDSGATAVRTPDGQIDYVVGWLSN
jgi:hypothetical protein